MRSSAQIRPWMPINKMFKWLQDAPDEQALKRRMAIWLTHTSNIHANKVAEILDVSTQAVWLWVRQYNTCGPDGLQRKGRGGRRWGFLTIQEERCLLKPFIQKIRHGFIPKSFEIKELVEKKLSRKVSSSYIYRMLARHGWSKILAQSQAIAVHSKVGDDFQNISRPWLRNI